MLSLLACHLKKGHFHQLQSLEAYHQKEGRFHLLKSLEAYHLRVVYSHQLVYLEEEYPHQSLIDLVASIPDQQEAYLKYMF